MEWKNLSEEAKGVKDGCKYMRDNGLCGKNPAATSSGECEAPCSYYESNFRS